MLRARRDDRDLGESLVEVLVSVTVLAVCGVAVGQGIALGIKVSDIHRKESVAGELVRDYAEHISTAIAVRAYPLSKGYISCAGTAAYQTPPGFSPDPGYSATIVSVTEPGCPGADPGVQTLLLKVASNDGRATEQLTIVVRNPCSPSDAAC